MTMTSYSPPARLGGPGKREEEKGSRVRKRARPNSAKEKVQITARVMALTRSRCCRHAPHAAGRTRESQAEHRGDEFAPCSSFLESVSARSGSAAPRCAVSHSDDRTVGGGGGAAQSTSHDARLRALAQLPAVSRHAMAAAVQAIVVQVQPTYRLGPDDDKRCGFRLSRAPRKNILACCRHHRASPLRAGFRRRRCSA